MTGYSVHEELWKLLGLVKEAQIGSEADHREDCKQLYRKSN